MFAWLSRGLVSSEDLCQWRFDGDRSKVEEVLKRTAGCMRELLSLQSLPETGDSEEKKLVKAAQQCVLPGGKGQTITKNN